MIQENFVFCGDKAYTISNLRCVMHPLHESIFFHALNVRGIEPDSSFQ